MGCGKKEETGSELRNLTTELRRKRLTYSLETEKLDIVVERELPATFLLKEPRGHGSFRVS